MFIHLLHSDMLDGLGDPVASLKGGNKLRGHVGLLGIFVLN